MDNKKALIVLIVTIVVIAIGTVIFLTMGTEKQDEVYTVTFLANNGSAPTSQSINEGEKVIMPTVPIKEGCVFVSWTLNGATYDFSSSVTSNITLEAKWQKVEEDVTTYLVSFDSDGGTNVENQVVKQGEKAVEPTAPTKDGFNFVSWTLNNVDFDFDTSITENLELKAKWEEVKEDNNDENKDKIEKVTVKTPTLTNAEGGKGWANLNIVTEGVYAKSTKDIAGYELYEKNGSKYTKIHSSTKDFGTKVTLDLGESKTYVARAYTYDKSNTKIYSAYSNSVKVENIVIAPTLSAAAGTKGYTELTTLLEGEYVTEADIATVAGFELYEKSGTKYTKVDSWKITIDVGESKTYVARAYAYNKSNQKVYSRYSNEVKLENNVEAPTLSAPAGGPHGAILDIVNKGAYDHGTELIDGWELYEKNDSKYTLIHSSETTYTKEIALGVGESKTYVARAYAYNKSNEKIYSEYSNEVKMSYTVVEPTLTTTMGGPTGGRLSIVFEGFYADAEARDTIDGVEIYEKDGNQYNKIYTSESNFETDVTLNEGESKTYVARVYAYNKSGAKVYSEYSNSIVLPRK